MSCYVTSAVSFIGPIVGFGGSLPLEHPSAATLHGSESSRVGEQCFELMCVGTVLFEPLALLPGTMKKGYSELLS